MARIYKVASEPWEYEQINRLNYRTFVEEIPQHPSNCDRLLVDRFNAENTYFICLEGESLAGMVAVRDKRPFSLDDKVPALDSYLPADSSLCELRLLAVDPQHRSSTILSELLHFAGERCIECGYSVAVASCIVGQKRLYSRMGFIPFATVVGSGEATYQPMYLTLESGLKLLERLRTPKPALSSSISFLPGPVNIDSRVRMAMGSMPVSHRSAEFQKMVREAKHFLCQHTGADHVELMLGSGTLANDVVAGQLKLLGGNGLVLSNGEFGERLVDHGIQGIVVTTALNGSSCSFNFCFEVFGIRLVGNNPYRARKR